MKQVFVVYNQPFCIICFQKKNLQYYEHCCCITIVNIFLENSKILFPNPSLEPLVKYNAPIPFLISNS